MFTTLLLYISLTLFNQQPLTQHVQSPDSHEVNPQFLSIRDEVAKRWQAFEKDRTFKPFRAGKSDATLAVEFDKIQKDSSRLFTTPEYETAHHLIACDLVRTKGCVAFAYNNTVPYYNASTVLVGEQCIIACEGPRPKDVISFFKLLNKQQVTHLVRLTDAHDGDKSECHPYWEGISRASNGQTYLDIPTENGQHSIRAFDMAYWKGNHAVDPNQLLAVVLQVRKSLADGRLLIHCSTGVGRTGTFLAAIAIVESIDRSQTFSIEEIIYRLSQQRVSSVGTANQYITLHRLAESYLRNKPIAL